MSAGKGDKPRPVNKKNYDSNFDKIEWNPLKTKSAIKTKGGKKTFKY
jgi:hypothetical protein